MHTLWLDENVKYDGSQLKPLTNYLKHGALGDSMVGWRGACRVSIDHMIDGEDARVNSKIEGDEMLHFVMELFQLPLAAAVALQRLMGEILIIKVNQFSEKPVELERKGDDVFWGKKKFNISIATCSNTSSLIHYGINVTNEGTPVETCSLRDFGIAEVEDFAQSFMDACKQEVLSLKRAMVKVRTF